MITQAHAAVWLGGISNSIRYGRALVAPERLYAPLSLTRTQASGALSTALAADDATWQEYAADIARFNGANRRLVIGGARTNLNPAVRTPFGTGWTNTNISAVTTVTGPDGVSGSAARINEGTATGTHLGITATFSATLGLSYAYSGIFRAGTCNFVQLGTTLGTFGSQAFANFDVATGVLGTAGTAVTRHTIRALGNGWYWCEMVVPATATATAISAGVFMSNSASAARSPSFAGTSRTLDVFWCWSEQAAFSSMPVLPPVGSAVTSARSADLVTASLASLGLPASGEGTYLWSGVLPQAAATTSQIMVQIDDGTANNRFILINSASSSTVRIQRLLAGASSASDAGTMTAGTPFRAGFTIGGGRAAASFNGNAAVSVTGGPSAGLTTLRLGSDSAGGANMFGETTAFRVVQRVASDEELPGLVMGMPQ